MGAAKPGVPLSVPFSALVFAPSSAPLSAPPTPFSAAVDKSSDTVAVHAIDEERFMQFVAALCLLQSANAAATETLAAGGGEAKSAGLGAAANGDHGSEAPPSAGAFDADVKRIRAEPSFRINPRRHLVERETTSSLERLLLTASLTTVSRPRADVCCVRDCCLASRPDTWNGDPDHCGVYVYGL